MQAADARCDEGMTDERRLMIEFRRSVELSGSEEAKKGMDRAPAAIHPSPHTGSSLPRNMPELPEGAQVHACLDACACLPAQSQRAGCDSM